MGFDYSKPTSAGTLNHSGLNELDYDSSAHTGFGRVPYEDASDPTVNNDGVDTAGIGVEFRNGDMWLDTSTNTIWILSDNSTGAAVWNIDSTDVTPVEPTGFPNRTDSIISWNSGTNEFEIDTVSGSFNYYYAGEKYTVSALDSVAINTAQGGLWFFYYIGDTLTARNITINGIGNVFDGAWVASLLWNATSNEVVSFGDERHGHIMDKATHRWAHNTIGMRYASANGGLTVTPPGSLPLAGSADFHTKIQLSNGVLYDEDLAVDITHQDVVSASDIWKQHLGIEATLSGYDVPTKVVTLSDTYSFSLGQVVTFFTSGGAYRGQDTVAAATTNSNTVTLTTGIGTLIATDVLETYAVIPVLYRSGATGEWKHKTITTANEQFPFIVGATPYPVYNNPAGPWTIPEVASTNFVAYWIIGTSDVYYPIQAIMGQRTDSTFGDAQANNKYEELAFGTYPFAEAKLLYRLIYQVRTSYTNSVNARLREITDYRNVAPLPAGTYVATAHSALTGLAYANSGHTGFGRTPFEAATDPTSDNDAVDTATDGREFRNGDEWLNTVSGVFWKCVDNSTGAAVWETITDLTIPTLSDKNLTCAVTASDEDAATAATVTSTPALDSYVVVFVNGVQVSVGDGVKTKDCYFSSDGGTTAKTIANIAAGDGCYWMGSVAGYELDASDRMDWYYVTTTPGTSSVAYKTAYDISIEMAEASQPPALYGNGVSYVPLINGNTDYIQFQFPVPPNVTSLTIHIKYRMSAANAGDVELHLDAKAYGDGEDITAALTAGAEFTVTPGNDTLMHMLDESSHATFTQTVSPGDILVCKLQRTADAQDTHTADMHITAIYAEA